MRSRACQILLILVVTVLALAPQLISKQQAWASPYQLTHAAPAHRAVRTPYAMAHLATASKSVPAQNVARVEISSAAAKPQTQLGPGDSQFEIMNQTFWITPGETLSARVRIHTSQPLSSLNLAMLAYPRVRHTADFEDSIDDNIRGSTLGLVQGTLDELVTSEPDVYELTLPTQDPALPRDKSRLGIQLGGVYPIRFELRSIDDNTPLERRTSFLVSRGSQSQIAPDVQAALVLPLRLSPDPARTDQDLSDQDNARITGLIDRVNSQSGLSLTLNPNGDLLDTIATSNADLLSRISNVFNDTNYVGSGYVDLDQFRPTNSPADQEVSLLEAANVQSLARNFERPPGAIAYLTSKSHNANDLTQLHQSGFRNILISEEMLQLEGTNQSLNSKIPVGSKLKLDDSMALNMLAYSTKFQTFLTANTEPFIAAARAVGLLYLDATTKSPSANLEADLAANLAVIPSNISLSVFDRMTDLLAPRSTNNAGSSSIADSSTGATTAFGAASTSGTASTTAAPFVKPVSLANAIAGLGEAPTAVTLRKSTASTTSSASNQWQKVVGLRQSYDAYYSMLPSASGLSDSLNRSLLRCLMISDDPTRRDIALNETASRIKAEFNKVSLASTRGIRLTSREAALPVTVSSSANYPIKVLVRVESDQLKFPAGNESIVDLVRENATTRFDVIARGSGAFPFKIWIYTPDGGALLAEQSITVQSTAFSNVGVVLSVLAALVLCWWWGRELLRSRSANSMKLEVDEQLARNQLADQN